MASKESNSTRAIASVLSRIPSLQRVKYFVSPLHTGVQEGVYLVGLLFWVQLQPSNYQEAALFMFTMMSYIVLSLLSSSFILSWIKENKKNYSANGSRKRKLV